MIHLLKFVLVFVLGAAVAWVGISFVVRSYNPNILSAHTSQGIQAKNGGQANIISDFLYDNLLPQIAKSPALAPLFETKRSIEDTYEQVSSLPDAQKAAVCQELCGSAPSKRAPSR